MCGISPSVFAFFSMFLITVMCVCGVVCVCVYVGCGCGVGVVGGKGGWVACGRAVYI